MSIFNPPNIYSEMVWNAVRNHSKKQKLTNIIGIYNCKIFYSTYISLISSFTNLSNTDNIEIYLNEGLESFFQWARIPENRFKSESEKFISYYSFELTDPYVLHFSKIFSQELMKFNSQYLFGGDSPKFIVLFDVESPMDLDEIYKEIKYDDFYSHLMDFIEEINFTEIALENFNQINKQFDLNIQIKDKLKLASWEVGKVGKMLETESFYETLVIKPFNEARCQICGDFTLREELSLVVESDEGWLLPMCPKCKVRNSL
jgi:hypothetical protein